MRLRSTHLIPFAILLLLGAALIGGCGDDGGPNGDFCQDNCAAVLAADCTNGPSDMGDCIEGCGYAQTTCPSEFNGLADCAGSSASYSCDDYDSPAPAKCAAENAELQACLMDGDAFCYQACPAVVAAGCTNGPTDVFDCLDGCLSAKTTCPTEWEAVHQCAGANATFSCSVADSPVADGCQSEGAALDACLQ